MSVELTNRLRALEARLSGLSEREVERSRRVENLEGRVDTLERLLNAAARANAGKELKSVGRG